MKKIILSLIAIMATMSINAQVVKVYENGSLSATYTNTASNTVRIVFEETPTTDANLLPGKFSVSATKQVQFTKSNLYWNGSAFKFEENQTDYQTTWDANHVSHFYWTTLSDYQSGDALYMPYAHYSKHSDSQSTSDKFWCSEDNPLTVDGTSGLYILTGGSGGEWEYLIKGRNNANGLCKYGVTVSNDDTNYTNCVIIAPDDFTGTLKSNYTLAEVNANGLVCLPGSGLRTSYHGITSPGVYGSYWSATPSASYSSYASCLISNDEEVYVSDVTREYGYPLRLVK